MVMIAILISDSDISDSNNYSSSYNNVYYYYMINNYYCHYHKLSY